MSKRQRYCETGPVRTPRDRHPASEMTFIERSPGAQSLPLPQVIAMLEAQRKSSIKTRIKAKPKEQAKLPSKYAAQAVRQLKGLAEHIAAEGFDPAEVLMTLCRMGDGGNALGLAYVPEELVREYENEQWTGPRTPGGSPMRSGQTIPSTEGAQIQWIPYAESAPSFQDLGFVVPAGVGEDTLHTLERWRRTLPSMKAAMAEWDAKESCLIQDDFSPESGKAAMAERGVKGVCLIEDDFSPEALPLVRELLICGGIPVAELETIPGGRVQ